MKILLFNPLNPKCDKHHFSLNYEYTKLIIHTLLHTLFIETDIYNLNSTYPQIVKN